MNNAWAFDFDIVCSLRLGIYNEQCTDRPFDFDVVSIIIMHSSRRTQLVDFVN